jgi:RimJ/RimL family protein N-acetyltransferase
VTILTVAKRNRGDDVGVHIRPIEPSDKALLADGLHCLSEASVRLRFLSSKPSFTAAELRYFTEVDGHDHIALVAIDDATGCLIGVARCVRLAGRPDTAEMAIVVGDAWQGQGIGRELAEELSAAARAAGIRRFEALIQAGNAPARAVARRIAARLREGDVSSGVRELSLDLAA